MVEAIRVLVALGFLTGFALYAAHAWSFGRALRRRELDLQRSMRWEAFVVAAGLLAVAGVMAALLNFNFLAPDVVGINLVLSTQMAGGVVLLVAMARLAAPEGTDPGSARIAAGILLATALASIALAAIQKASDVGFQVQIAIAINIGTIAAATSLLAWHLRARSSTGSSLAATLAMTGANALVLFLFVRAVLVTAPEETQLQVRLVSGLLLILGAGLAAPGYRQLVGDAAVTSAEASRAATRPST